MKITSRQFGQIEAACFALEEATEKNNTALRLVKVIKDNLAEIAKTAYPLELVFEFDQPELPMVESDPSDLLATAKRSEDGSDLSDKIKALRQITQSVAELSDQHKDHQIAVLRQKLADKEEQLSAAENEWRARVAELLAKIAALENNTSSGMSAETLERVEEKIKLL